MSVILLATAVTVAIPSFGVHQAPPFLAAKMANDYAAALAELHCADPISLPTTRPGADRAVAECDANSACIADVGRSAAADWVLVGHLEQIDDKFDTRFKLIEVRDFTSRRSFGTLFSGALAGLSQSIRDYAPVICQKINPGWTNPSMLPAKAPADLPLDDLPAPGARPEAAATATPSPPPLPNMVPCATTPNPRQKDEAMQKFRGGKRSMDAGQFKEALAAFEEAHCSFPAPALRRAVSEAQLKLGQCHAAEVSAELWQKEAGADEREAVSRWLNQVHASCINVSLSVRPDGATLVIDGETRGVSAGQWAGQLLVGLHSVVVASAGFKPQQVQLTGISGKPITATVALDREPAPIRPPIAAVVKAAALAPPDGIVQPKAPSSVRELEEPRPTSGPAKPETAATGPAEVVSATPRVRWEPFIPASVALVGVVLAISGGVTAGQCPATASSPGGIYGAQVCQANRAVLADVGWGVAGAGAAATGVVLFLVLRSVAGVAQRDPPVQFGVLGSGVQLSARF